MGTVSVWAPRAKAVQLQISGRRIDMQAGPRGWWRIETPDARAGADYAFVLDGGEALPDPRSAWQPDSVHGPSRFVDHEAFAWTDAHWRPRPLESAIVYELHVGTFTPQGTFDSAIERLDHLVDLGITHLELMPVNEFPGGRGWGYDGVDLFAPHHAYGGPDGLKRLVNASHAKGLAVLLDVVYNHLGPSGNYLDRFGPYFTTRYGTPWGPAVNLDDADSDEVRHFLCDNAIMWLRDYHCDGLRLDAVHAIHDSSAVHFLEELAVRVSRLQAQLGRQLVQIAESDLNDARLVQSREAGGYGLDAQWSDDFHHALHVVLTGERAGYYADFGTLADLAKALEHAYVYDGRYSEHRRRRHGRPFRGLTGHRFLAYLQNHDQVGNRAQGDRSSHLISTGRLKIGAALVLTSPFVPMLFQGEEWGATSPFQYFTDHQEPELAQAVREGRRSEFASFGWKPQEVPDPQAVETFERSKLDWSELGKSRHADVLDWHRRLIQLRYSLPALMDGRLEEVGTRFDEADRWLVVQRGPIVVACNLADCSRAVPLAEAKERRLLLASESGVNVSSDAVTLPGDAVAILSPA